jgi:hypothetical protein
MAQVKRGETVEQDVDKIRHRYFQSGMWRCPCSPSGAHHWLVDDRGVGKCKYCGEERQFAKFMVTSYTRLRDMQSDTDSSSEKAFKEG